MPSNFGGDSRQVRRQENLAFAFQELLTVCERLRSGRQQVSDSETFRAQIREAIRRADAEARNRGYTAEQIRLAVFAVVAFLDESVLNLRNPVFADWPRRPMQEELFGLHVAGEVFFQNLQKLLGMSDTHEVADVLEVYQLCLLLGFAGRYSLSGRGELRSIVQAVGEKIRRIRPPLGGLAPEAYLPSEPPARPSRDPLVKWFVIGAAGSAALALMLFVIYKLALSSGVSGVGELAGRALL